MNVNVDSRALAQPPVLPMTRREMDRLGWDELDVLLISGDAYVDHPSFGVPLLGRWLVAHGFRTGIIAQPAWTRPDSLGVMGRPRLFAGVSAGTLDSMLAHYTAFRKKRSDDAYTPGGQAGARPNRACLVYSSLIKQVFPKLPIILGGIEASLRRIAHYDFWTDRIRRSILLDAKADLLLYGMAERAIVAYASLLDTHLAADTRVGPADLLAIPNAVFAVSGDHLADLRGAFSNPPIELPSQEQIQSDPNALMSATLMVDEQVHHSDYAIHAAEGRHLILTPPRHLDQSEHDALYALPFTRDPHPSYKQPIPAAEMIRFSITAHRGCASGCTFCSLAAHQGRSIRSRSAESLLAEAQTLAAHPKFNGSISDVGGPSANMWGGRCSDDPHRCRRASCLFPAVCPHFEVDQSALLELLKQIKRLPRVKHVRIASGIRYDLALKDRNYIRTLVREFVGGQLKIAPEHFSDAVLRLMRKPGQRVFEQFLSVFEEECRAAGKEQYVVPYLLTAFPGCTPKDMQYLSSWLQERGWRPQQMQCFIPLPSTVAAAMYHAGIDTHNQPIPIPKSDADRLRQHHMLTDAPPSRRPDSKKPQRHRGTEKKRWERER